MPDTLYRQWTMLQRIPRLPRKVSTADLEQYLRDAGYSVNRRTIQRDLNALATEFPLDNETHGQRNLWFWMKDANVMDIPGMQPEAALAFCLADTYLKPLLPHTVLSQLESHFEKAREVLAPRDGALGLWPERVRIIERGPDLKPPEVAPEVQQAVYDALLHDRMLDVGYRARNADKAARYELHPLALVVRRGLLYLVCRFEGHQDVRHVTLHRMKSARVLDSSCRRPAGFDLDAYLASGAFGYPVSDGDLQLRLRIDNDTAFHLEECPLSSDQALRPDGDGHTLLQATVPDTQELRWWLLGLGSRVEVRKPVRLRRELAKTIAQMAGFYS